MTKPMTETSRSVRIAALALAALLKLSSGPAQATSMESDAQTILSFAVEGITLAMTPDEARAELESSGYELFDAMGVDQSRPFGWRYTKGRSALRLERHNGLLTEISLEVFPGPTPIDAQSEIANIQRHFGASASEKWCWRNEQGGACSVKSREDGRLTVLMTAAPFGLTVVLRRRLAD